MDSLWWLKGHRLKFISHQRQGFWSWDNVLLFGFIYSFTVKPILGDSSSNGYGGGPITGPGYEARKVFILWFCTPPNRKYLSISKEVDDSYFWPRLRGFYLLLLFLLYAIHDMCILWSITEIYFQSSRRVTNWNALISCSLNQIVEVFVSEMKITHLIAVKLMHLRER